MNSQTEVPRTATSHPRRRTIITTVIGVAAAGALALGGVSLTNAWFTSQATVTGESVSTATIEITATTKAESSPIQATNFLPGDSASTVITAANSGSEALYYSLSLTSVTGETVIRDALRVTVDPGSGAPAVTRSLSEWQSGEYSGLRLNANAASDVTVTVALPLTTGDQNDLQDKTASFAVQFDAIQQRNVTVPSTGWEGTNAAD